jgi:hypothetical protein
VYRISQYQWNFCLFLFNITGSAAAKAKQTQQVIPLEDISDDEEEDPYDKEDDQEEDSIDLEEYKSADEADLHKDMVSTPARCTKKTPSKGTPSGESPIAEVAKAVSQLRVFNSSVIPAFVPSSRQLSFHLQFQTTMKVKRSCAIFIFVSLVIHWNFFFQM